MSSNETITIVPMDEENLALFNSFPSSFTITGNVWAGNDGFFHFFVEEFPEPHAAKTYPDGTLGEAEGQAVFFAMESGRCVGQIHLRRAWNGMLSVEDIRVREDCRRRGVGRKLLDAAVAYGKAQGYAALRLECQNNNVGACRFYAEYGFLLMGMDQAVYMTTPHKGETALYWYYALVPMEELMERWD